MKPIRKLLVANRGEIAVRIIRTCRELDITSVAVYSEPDRTALHVRLADEAFPLGGVTAAESYLQKERILQIAQTAGADAIHPGYGFLSENPDFAALVEKSDIRFVGPPSRAIRAMGDKTAARRTARMIGIPVVPGTQEHLVDLSEALKVASEIGYPVLLKAAAGGGGKGMRIVNSPDAMAGAFQSARSEALNAFGDSRVFMEKYIHSPRHVEIQIVADTFGNVLWLGERECSIQRRHQKVIEESPSPAIDGTVRAAMGNAAVRLAKASGYVNAGTLEFILDTEGRFFFLEMNTRLQVEHPVTELVTGLDLVRLQIAIAEEQPLPVQQSEVTRSGHAIECRVYAEDPTADFFPSTGRLKFFRIPSGPRLRVDSGFEQGDTVHVYYDAMLAKVITWGRDRDEAISIMERALSEFVVSGVQTTIPFCRFVLQNSDFRKGIFDTHFVANQCSSSQLGLSSPETRNLAMIAGALIWSAAEQRIVDSPSEKDKHERGKWKTRRDEYLRS